MGPHNACSYADLAMTIPLATKVLTLIPDQTILHFHQIGQDFETIVLALGLQVYQLC